MQDTVKNSEVYAHPAYYALGYRWNTETECDFVDASLKLMGPEIPKDSAPRLLDIGCGAGRHAMLLAKRGWKVTGIDPSQPMVDFVQAQAKSEKLPVTALVGELSSLGVSGPFDAAICFMDTFRFLLGNESIHSHLMAVADLLAPGGLYITDFWVPRQWDTIGSEIHQWEQTQGDTMVRVFYVQHPDSVDPIAQTFEDELVFEVHEGGDIREVRGGRTRTRLILPQEFRALVAGTGRFAVVGTFGEFDLTKPFTAESLSWRMISVLKKVQ